MQTSRPEYIYATTTARVLRDPPGKPTEEEVKIFSREIVEVIADKIEDLETYLFLTERKRESIVRDFSHKIRMGDDIEMAKTFLASEIAQIEREKDCIRRWAIYWKRIVRLLAKLKGQPVLEWGDEVTDEMIFAAKEVPIDTALSDAVKWMNGRSVVTCPFHDEKTPSMTLYKATDSYYCFGCGAWGDTISLYQKIYDCDFKQAVLGLLKE